MKLNENAKQIVGEHSSDALHLFIYILMEQPLDKRF